MKRREFLERLDRAAEELVVVRLPMVYAGGATMPFCVDGETDDVRETKDIRARDHPAAASISGDRSRALSAS